MIRIDPSAVRRAIEAVAAEEILPRFNRLGHSDVREKSPGQVVTVADEAAESRLIAALTSLLPGSRVVGEETVETDPASLANLLADDPVWIIDPLDGTANFAQGRACFAVLVALAHRGETIQGWLHDPIGGGTVVAEKGAGAFSATGERLRFATGMPLSAMTGYAVVRFLPPAQRRHVEAHRDRLGGIETLMCAGHEYLDLLRGARQFSLYRRTKPWDHAAGTLAVREAGGHVARHDGAPYRLDQTSGGLLTAPDAVSWRSLQALLIPPEHRVAD